MRVTYEASCVVAFIVQPPGHPDVLWGAAPRVIVVAAVAVAVVVAVDTDAASARACACCVWRGPCAAACCPLAQLQPAAAKIGHGQAKVSLRHDAVALRGGRGGMTLWMAS